MDVEITLRHDEIFELLNEVAPVRIHLTEGDEDRRFVELERPSEVVLVPGLGLRIVTSGRVRHELAGVGLPFEVRRVQILMTPVVVTGHHGQRLDFKLRVEQGDLENVPGLVEGVVIVKVNDALEPERLGTYFEIAKALTLSVPLPERYEPLNRLLVTARAVHVATTQDAIIVRLGLGLNVSRSQPRPSTGPVRSV